MGKYRKKDWVVGSGYGVSLIILAQELRFIPLYGLPIAASEEVDEVEDDNDELFLFRVVGTFDGAIEDTVTVAHHDWGVRLMPCIANIDTSLIVPPVDITTNTLDTPDFANLRWWAERRRFDLPPHETVGESYDVFAHPHWSSIDVRPGQVFGQKMNLYPTLVVWNGAADDMRFEHRFRLLVGYT